MGVNLLALERFVLLGTDAVIFTARNVPTNFCPRSTRGSSELQEYRGIPPDQENVCQNLHAPSRPAETKLSFSPVKLLISDHDQVLRILKVWPCFFQWIFLRCEIVVARCIDQLRHLSHCSLSSVINPVQPGKRFV